MCRTHACSRATKGKHIKEQTCVIDEVTAPSFAMSSLCDSFGFCILETELACPATPEIVLCKALKFVNGLPANGEPLAVAFHCTLLVLDNQGQVHIVEAPKSAGRIDSSHSYAILSYSSLAMQGICIQNAFVLKDPKDIFTF